MEKVSRIEFNQRYFRNENDMWNSIRDSIRTLVKTGYVLRCVWDVGSKTFIIDYEKVNIGVKPFPFFLTIDESAVAVVAKMERKKQEAQDILDNASSITEIESPLVASEPSDDEEEAYDIELLDEVGEADEAIKKTIKKKKSSA